MTELSFAKAFLTSLDSKPNKFSAEHVEDPRSYPARGATILPKMARPLPKRQKLSPGQERTLNITLKSLRNPPLDISLTSLPLSTSILTLKESIQTQTSIPTSKLRILYQKKPLPDSKILKDLVGEDADVRKVEFSVMVIGGAAALKSGKEEEEVEPKVAVGVHGNEALRTEAFWGDLRGFLVQRLRDESEGERVFKVFRKAIDAER